MVLNVEKAAKAIKALQRELIAQGLVKISTADLHQLVTQMRIAGLLGLSPKDLNRVLRKGDRQLEIKQMARPRRIQVSISEIDAAGVPHLLASWPGLGQFHRGQLTIEEADDLDALVTLHGGGAFIEDLFILLEMTRLLTDVPR